MDQDRHAPLGGELEHRPEPLVGRAEPLRARMELDPAGAGVEAAPRLLDRRLVEVEADERDEPSLDRSANASVRSFAALNAGCRSGSSRQNMNAREMPYLSISLELVVVADHAVDVVPEVQVRVEDVGARRQQPPISSS